MFKFGRKAQQEPKVIVRTVTRYVDRDEDVKLKARVEKTVKLGTDEYARLHAEVNEMLNRRDAGNEYAGDRERLTRMHGEMTALVRMLAMVKGTDLIVEVAQMDRQANTRVDEGFPMTSFISGSSPLYAPVDAR